jgi:hypothetical protein
MKKNVSFGVLLSLICVFAAAPSSASQMGQIAIFTESVGWTTVQTANAQAQIIIDDLRLTREIEVLGDAEIGAFAKENTNDGDLDIIITFGYFPVSLYTPGNAQADGSVGEEFLEGGNMFLNTADYIFYVTQGGGATGDVGLKNMTDSTFDLWTDGVSTSPTEDGEKYTPSLIASSAPRCFQISQINANSDWELEVAFGDDGGANADPAVIYNTDYGGRVGIFFQVSNDAMPRGQVVTEILDNWLSEKVSRISVEPADKLSVTWGRVKQSF